MTGESRRELKQLLIHFVNEMSANDKESAVALAAQDVPRLNADQKQTFDHTTALLREGLEPGGEGAAA